MASMLQELVTIDNKTYRVVWRERDFTPPRAQTTQASGLCFTGNSRIILVRGAGREWSLPGGHPEQNETPDQALVREVAEEACAKVTELSYLGCQEVAELTPDHQVAALYYQTRFWCRVELRDFAPHHETADRIAIPPSQFVYTLNWSTQRMALEILRLGLREESLRPIG